MSFEFFSFLSISQEFWENADNQNRKDTDLCLFSLDL